MTTREEEKNIKNNKKINKKKNNNEKRERVSKAAAGFLTCHSSNRKRLPRLHQQHQHHHHHHHLRCSTTFSDSEPDHDDTLTRSLPSSDFLMHMPSRAHNFVNPCSSSLASCPAFSFDDNCPSTPSPVCSPLSSDLLLLLHHPPHQSKCAMASGCKKLVVGDQEVSSPLHKIIREGGEGGGEKQSFTPKSNGSDASRLSRSACRYLQYDKEIIVDNNNNNNNNNCEDGGRVMLPVLVEEKEDKVVGCNNGDHLQFPPLTQFSHFSTDHEDEYYYTGSSSGGGGRGSEEYDGNSENESVVEKEERVRPKKDRPMNGIVVVAASDIRTEVEAKLNAWKQAKTCKLLNKLRNEEAAIAEWERKEMEKAKIEMKRLEMKLEKQRERKMMRMHRKIRHVKEHAEQKTLKERETTARKISGVSKSFDGINTGKISWKLICC